MSGFRYIKRLMMAVMLLLLALASAMAQEGVYTGQTTTLAVEQNGADTYQWELYSDSTVNFAVEPGDPSPMAYADFVGGSAGTSVDVLWKKPGIYYFKVTSLDAAGCAMNIKVGRIKVLESLPTATITPPDIKGVCAGEAITLEITLTGKGPWSFTYTDGTKEWEITNVQDSQNPYFLVVNPGPVVTTQYWINKITDARATNTEISNKVTQVVNPLPAPPTIYHR